MNLQPPPRTDDIEEMRAWMEDLYKFLQFPTVEMLRFIPRSAVPDDTQAGVVYYDSDDNKLKVRDDNSWEDTY